jgi:hypothetical protein
LSYNTITNPRNNITYNKYLNKFTHALDTKIISKIPNNINNKTYDYDDYHNPINFNRKQLYDNSSNNQQNISNSNHHISINDYKKANPNLFNNYNPHNQSYNMNINNTNFKNINYSGKNVRLASNKIMN